MAKLLSNTRVYGTATVDTQLFVKGFNSAHSTTTGALQVSGGIGVAGGGFFSGAVTATNFIGSVSGTASTANNIAGGTAGQLLYQSAPSTTAFVGPGTSGQLLISQGSSSPIYVNTTTFAVGLAKNLLGGAADQFAYQTAANQTAFATTASMYVGNAVTATNVRGGTAGQFVYQTAPGVTAFINTGSMYVGRAVVADTVIGGGTTVETIQQTANASYFLTFVDSNNATSTAELVYTTSSFVVNAASGAIGLGTATPSDRLHLSGTQDAARIRLTNTTAGRSSILGHGSGGFYWQPTNNGDLFELRNSAGSGIVAFNPSSESLGIGTTGPSRKLHVAGSTEDTRIRVSANDGSNIRGFEITAATTFKGGIFYRTTEGNVLQVWGPNTGSGAIYIDANNMVRVVATTSVHSTATGAFQVAGGIGVAGGGFFGGIVTATTFVGNVIGTVSQAADIAGGTAGQLLYQIAPNDTGFAGPGTAGQVLTSGGTGAPVYVNTSSLYVGRAVLADSATTANSASQVQTVQRTTNAAHFLTFVDSNNGSATAETIYTNNNFVVNPSTGNVGIGTTGPNALLSFGTSVVDNKIYVYDGTNDKYGFGIRSDSFLIYSGAGGASTGGILFGKFNGTTFTESMRIRNDGNVGIGDVSPTQKLVVAGAAVVTGGIYGSETGAPDSTIWAVSGDFTNWGIFYNEGDPDFIEYKSAGTVTSRIALDTGAAHFGINGGSVGIGTTSPGAKLEIENGDIWLDAPGGGNPEIRFIDDGGIAVAGAKIRYENNNGNLYFEHVWDQPTSGIFFRNRTAGTSLNTLTLMNGYVGIGNTSPSYRLDVSAAASPFQTVARFGSGGSDILITHASAIISHNASYNSAWTRTGSGYAGLIDFQGGQFTFQTSPTTAAGGSSITDFTTRFQITNAGNVGVGPNSPSFRLDITGTARATSDVRAPIFYDSDNTAYYLDPASTSRLYNVEYFNGGQALFYTVTNNSLRGYIQATDTDDAHFIIATSGGEDISFRDGGLSGSVNMVIRGNATVESYGDFRAPIFYDSNNTAFYADPASTSRFNKLLITDSSTSYIGGMQNGTLELGSISNNYKYTSGWISSMQGGILANCANNWEMIIHDSGDALASPFCYNGGASNRNFEIGRDLGWGTMYTTVHQSTRSPIFYDSDNTAFYTDPASTSDLNALKVNAIYLDRAEAAARGISWYSPTYTSWAEYMSPAGATGCGPTGNITAPSGVTLVTSWALRSFIENASGYGWTWESGSATGQPTVVAQIRSSDGSAQFNGSVRSPIFYDSNDTNFYTDPASTSNVNRVQTRRLAANPDGNTNDSTVGTIGLWTNPESTTSTLMFKRTDQTFGTHGGVTDIYATYWLMDTTNRGWIFRNATTNQNIFSISNNNGTTTLGTSFSAALAQLNVSQGQGSATTYRDIDLKGSWAANEGHAITATHASGANNIVGQMVFEHNSPGSRIKFGRLYHSGDVGTYPMNLISNDSSGNARLEMSASSDMRSPIFYDSNNTAFYVDGNSESRLYRLRVGPYAGSTTSGNQTGLEIINTSGTGDGDVAAMSFHCGGYWGLHMHLRADSYFGIGGWSASAWRWYVQTSTGNGTYAGSVTATAFFYSSDRKLKKDIESLSLKKSLDIIKSLNPVHFTWKDSNKLDTGFIAQEVQEILPEAVETNLKLNSKGEEDEPYLTLKSSSIVAHLTKVVQHQQQLIEQLIHNLDQSNQRIESLEKLLKKSTN